MDPKFQAYSAAQSFSAARSATSDHERRKLYDGLEALANAVKGLAERQDAMQAALLREVRARR